MLKIYDSMKYGGYMDMWLASFARTPHPFNHESIRDTEGNIVRPSLTESELLGMENATKQALTPEEQDIYNLLTKKRKLKKGESRPNPQLAKEITKKASSAARAEQTVREDYTPTQLNAVKRKQLLRPKALKFDEPSTILPGITKGEELEQAYKTLRDPIVKNTVNDIARLDRYQRQVKGQLKPHERTLDRISAAEAMDIQKRLQASKTANPDTFNQIIDVHRAINNTAKNPEISSVSGNIPGMKDTLVKNIKAGNTVIPTYVNNPESLAYAGQLQQRQGNNLIPDSRVSGLTEAEINKAKRKGLQIGYNPTQRIPQSAIDKRISMIENISNSLDTPIELPQLGSAAKPITPALPSEVVKPSINVPSTIIPPNPTGANPYRTAIVQGLMQPSELPIAEQTKLALDSLNSSPINRPNPIQNVQNRFRALEAAKPNNPGPIQFPVDDAINNVKQRYGALVGQWNPLQDIQNLSRKINPPTNPVEPIVNTPTPTPDPMANPFTPTPVVENTPKPRPIPRSTGRSLEERIADRVTKRLQNVPQEPVVKPNTVAPESLIGKWRALPRESRGLAKIGLGVLGAGGLLMAQNALANSIANKRQTEQSDLQRQQMLYSPMPRPIEPPNQYPYT